MQNEIARCEAEIASAQAALAGGDPDVAGLCLAIADWSAELRLIRAACVSDVS